MLTRNLAGEERLARVVSVGDAALSDSESDSDSDSDGFDDDSGGKEPRRRYLLKFEDAAGTTVAKASSLTTFLCAYITLAEI